MSAQADSQSQGSQELEGSPDAISIAVINLGLCAIILVCVDGFERLCNNSLQADNLPMQIHE
jgi:hypothetical protein